MLLFTAFKYWLFNAASTKSEMETRKTAFFVYVLTELWSDEWSLSKEKL